MLERLSISRELENEQREIREKKSTFEVFTEDTVANAIKNIPTGMASISTNTIVFIIKETLDAYCPKLTQIMNGCLKNNFFLIY